MKIEYLTWKELEEQIKNNPIFILPIGSIEPVSYTHLDVYKRQAKVAAACAILEASIPGPLTTSYPNLEIWVVAIGVIAQALSLIHI